MEPQGALHSPRPVALAFLLLALALLLPGHLSAVDNTPGVQPAQEKFPEGARTYREHCAACHETGAGRAPARVILSYMTPHAIIAALTGGAMQAQGAALEQQQKEQVAQYLSGQTLGNASTALPEPPPCTPDHALFDRKRVPAFAGAGIDLAATHSVGTGQAGIDRTSVGRLKLKWAFGFPLANRARSQPALGGGAIFVGSHGGKVYALDRETGCTRWTFDAGSEVRTGIVLSLWKADDANAVPLAYFGDWAGNAYAVEAFTGKLAWKVHADAHPAAVITASPALYGDTLYVPVSSLEEASAATPGYLCCSFRGSVLALDSRTGAAKWRTWLVDEPVPQDGGKSLGPSGVPVWAGIAIDAKRASLIVATGDNYTHPTTDLSDALVAMDLRTGAIKWHFQALEGDAWNVDCVTPDPDNCPEDAGPDYDFGAIPILAADEEGRDYVLAGQKSGIAWAVDAQTGGLIWKRQVGRGGMAGGVHFGLAEDNGRVYVAISDMPDGVERPFPAAPGIHALDLKTGETLWDAPPPEQVCEGRPLCLPGNSGAITVTPDLVLAGGDDGYLRILDAATGEELWQFDTAQDFSTVNGVPAKGGAMSGGAAPIVDNGQLIMSSGYGFVSKMPGNVLMVFEVE
ncbi:PQQ-binding-like beta-propeller repeat protein [Novosphingobium mangrovi (ex Huang et al. 2023)]|uniref:PQQ-binding-like beta-propeller repeat protein n=1 Tax=Novosphingobium mangrovi (ex Huang et al. 2023) TaxID=2976432 RepID=A0ABT2I636_9SPHN|nr:PQQ-binding-like beta-propeller repeat protein [Novosphingobium mangrovi (ex Huang et al. 2023)]MCT2400269.1 PQQ-binding-like beta-propeller repeat protein [Novosphingobium mangrovi (ex Huang et al. 2023)]